MHPPQQTINVCNRHLYFTARNKSDAEVAGIDKLRRQNPLSPADRNACTVVSSSLPDPTKRAYHASMRAPGQNLQTQYLTSGEFKAIVSMEGCDCHFWPHLEIVSLLL